MYNIKLSIAFGLGIMAVVSTGCDREALPSATAGSSLSKSQATAVQQTWYRINRAVGGTTRSVFVTYRDNAPSNYLDWIIGVPGVRFVFDSPSKRYLSLEIAEGALTSVQTTLAAAPWIHTVQVRAKGSSLRALGTVSKVRVPRGWRGGLAAPTATPSFIRRSDAIPWGVHFVNGDLVHSTFADSGRSIKVGIIDSGIDCSLSDLPTSLVVGGDDYTDYSPNYCADSYGHGTAVAIVLGAVANSGGLLGMAPAVSLFSYRTITSDRSNHPAYVASALHQARQDGIQVLNISFGDCGSAESTTYTEVLDGIDSAVTAGIVVVAAAGDGTRLGDCTTHDSISSPATRPGVIAVGAANRDSTTVSGTQTGPEMFLLAPDSVESEDTTGYVSVWTGLTSAATPHVAGAAALILAKGWSASLVPTLLAEETQDKPGSGLPLSYSTTRGYGILDAAAAVLPTPQISYYSVTGDSDCVTNILYAGDTCTVTPVLASWGYFSSLSYGWQDTVTNSGSISGYEGPIFEFTVGGDGTTSFYVELWAQPSDEVTTRHYRWGEWQEIDWVVCPTGSENRRPAGASKPSIKRSAQGTNAPSFMVRSLNLAGPMKKVISASATPMPQPHAHLDAICP